MKNFEAVEKQDGAFKKKIDDLKQNGKVLRYLAQIESEGKDGKPSIKVGPVDVDANHPAARLRGAESFVAFYTKRYGETPLVVQGAGAGGAVTAAGVLADILKTAHDLKGV